MANNSKTTTGGTYIKKADYYSDRVMRGKFEAKYSVTRKTYIQLHNRTLTKEPT